MAKKKISGGNFVARFKKKTNTKVDKLEKELKQLKAAQKKQAKFEVMAKKKRRSRSSRRAAKKSTQRPKGMLDNVLSGTVGTIVGSMVYGGIREKVSDMVLQTPLGKIPAGEVSDEAAMIVAGVLVKRMVRPTGVFRKVVDAGLAIESARAGEVIADRGFNNLFSQKRMTATGGAQTVTAFPV